MLGRIGIPLKRATLRLWQRITLILMQRTIQLPLPRTAPLLLMRIVLLMLRTMLLPLLPARCQTGNKQESGRSQTGARQATARSQTDTRQVSNRGQIGTRQRTDRYQSVTLMPTLMSKQDRNCSTDTEILHALTAINHTPQASKSGTTVTEYMRPGARGISANSIKIQYQQDPGSEDTAGGPAYQKAIEAMLEVAAHLIDPKIHIMWHDADTPSHAENAFKNFHDDGLYMVTPVHNMWLTSDNISDSILQAGYTQPCFIVPAKFKSTLHDNQSIQVWKINMGGKGPGSRGEARDKFLNETSKIYYKQPIQDKEYLQEQGKYFTQEGVMGVPGDYYMVASFTADKQWKMTHWPEPTLTDLGKGPRNKKPWELIASPIWREFFINEKMQLAPKQGKAAERLAEVEKQTTLLGEMRKKKAMACSMEYAVTQGKELATSQNARAELDRRKEEAAITQVTPHTSPTPRPPNTNSHTVQSPNRKIAICSGTNSLTNNPTQGNELSRKESLHGDKRRNDGSTLRSGSNPTGVRCDIRLGRRQRRRRSEGCHDDRHSVYQRRHHNPDGIKDGREKNPGKKEAESLVPAEQELLLLHSEGRCLEEAQGVAAGRVWLQAGVCVHNRQRQVPQHRTGGDPTLILTLTLTLTLPLASTLTLTLTITLIPTLTLTLTGGRRRGGGRRQQHVPLSGPTRRRHGTTAPASDAANIATSVPSTQPEEGKAGNANFRFQPNAEPGNGKGNGNCSRHRAGRRRRRRDSRNLPDKEEESRRRKAAAEGPKPKPQVGGAAGAGRLHDGAGGRTEPGGQGRTEPGGGRTEPGGRRRPGGRRQPVKAPTHNPNLTQSNPKRITQLQHPRCGEQQAKKRREKGEQKKTTVKHTCRVNKVAYTMSLSLAGGGDNPTVMPPRTEPVNTEKHKQGGPAGTRNERQPKHRSGNVRGQGETEKPRNTRQSTEKTYEPTATPTGTYLTYLT